MKHCTKEELIAFETRMKALWEAGELPYLVHLCGGNEDQLIKIFEQVEPGDWVFSGHRSHYHYLLSGGSPEKLEQMIRRGDSMFVFGRPAGVVECGSDGSKAGIQTNFYTSSVLAGTCGIAAGVAWQIKFQHSNSPALQHSSRPPRVWCFLGDGAEEQGHFYEAVMFVEGHDLPCTFIIEDNNRSVDTLIHQRRGTGGLFDTLASYADCVEHYGYTPSYPHAGSGCAHQIHFNPAVVSDYLGSGKNYQ